MMFRDDDVVMNIDNYSNIYNLNNTNHTNRNVYTFMKESLILFFHQILYYRSIYPIEVFLSSRPECINGILCYICQHPFIIQYIDSFVQQVIEIIRNDHHHQQNDQNDDNNDNAEFIDCVSFIILDQKKEDRTNNDHKNRHDSLDDNQHVTSQMESTSSTQSTNDTSTIANSNNSNNDQQDILVPKEGYMLQFLNDHSMNHTNNSIQNNRRNNNSKKKIKSLPYNRNRDHLVSKIERKEKEQQQHKDKHHSLWILWERSIREMILRIQRSSNNNITPIMNNNNVSQSSCNNDQPISIWSEFVTFQLHIHRKIKRNSTSLLLYSVKETESATIKNLTWNSMNNNNNEWIIWNDQHDNNDDDDEEVIIVEEKDSSTLHPKQTKSKNTTSTTSIRPLDEYMTPFGTIQLMSIIY